MRSTSRAAIRARRGTRSCSPAGFAYALSPIDLIPDFIPVLGYLDDIIVVPLGLSLTVRLIPREVMEECRMRAAAARGPRSRVAAAVVVVIWIALAALAVWLVYNTLA